MTKRSYFYVLFSLLFLCLSFIVEAQTHYVKVNSTGDGSSWGNASGDLQAILDAASEGDSICLAKGSYTPTTCTTCDDTDRQHSFVITKGISIFGGFPDTGNPSLEDRDGALYRTNLSGDIGIAGEPADNSFHVIRIDSVAGYDVTLDGLIINGGNANDSLDSSPNGAGVLCINSSLKLNNCVFSNNKSTGNGAAFYGEGEGAEFTLCTFDNNNASSGGAIFMDSEFSSPITNCIFKNNSATNNGGAVCFANQIALDIFGSVFHGNNATYGGSVHVEKLKTGYSNYSNIKHCTFVDNTASSTGSILHVSELTSNISFRNSICWSNQLPAFHADSVTGYYSDIDMLKNLTDEEDLDSLACCDLLSGYDNYLNSSDPFADYDNKDFTLLSNSVATNKGYYHKGSANCNYDDDCVIDPNSGRNRSAENVRDTDLLGHPRRVKFPDIGAYEFFDENDYRSVLYVNPNATGLNNGFTWTDAFTTIEEALNQARNYVVDAIWIAEGTYVRSPENTNTSSFTATYDLAFRSEDSLSIYGGFPNTGNPSLSDRDWTNHPTILSAEAGVPDSLGDNYGTILGQGFFGNAIVTIDGLTLSDASYYGISLYNELAIVNSTFTNNNRAIRVNTRGDFCDGKATIINSNFHHNNTAISVEEESDIDLFDSRFSNNQGAISLSENCNIIAENCSFTNNHSTNRGGAIYGDEDTYIKLNRCHFENNSATDYGGAIFYDDLDYLFVTNSTFVQNHSDRGGVVAGYGHFRNEEEFTNCTFYNNTSTNGGSIAYVQTPYSNSNSLEITNCIVWDHERPFVKGGEPMSSPIVFNHTLSNFEHCDSIAPGISCDEFSFLDTLSPFVDLANLDLQLNDSSIAINHGGNDFITTDFDLQGNDRINGLHTDIGAYEYAGDNAIYSDLDNDGVTSEFDCHDLNPSISPNLLELIYNGIDDDCNPATLDDDLDQDGYVLANDCDDNDSSINPASPEIPYNGIDDDCYANTLDDDYDQDGFGLADDCNDNNPLVNQDAPEVPYNGIDDDCNEATPDDDIDQDGFGVADDCDDNNPLVNINGTEIPYNGIDDDCNALTLDDDLDQDGFGIADDCDDNNPLVNMGTIEIPYNGIDDDCDETTLDDDLDQDGFGVADDCNDYNPMINPGYEEVPYNGIDEDCDETTLDDDLDEDGFGIADDCDDNNPLVNQGNLETPYNGIDDDCNEATLDDDLDQDGFDLADDCDDQNPAINSEAVEIANNSIDEDCDGEDLIISSNNNTITIQPQVFPNPTSDLLQIVFPNSIEGTYELNDLSGKLIIQGVLQQELMLNLASQAQGVYILSIKMDEGTWTERIVKI